MQEDKQDIQITTTVNKNYYDELDPIYQYAVDYRLDNMKYRDIAGQEKIGVKETTVRTWFAVGGICYLAFEQKKKERAEEREQLFKEIKEKELKDLATDAIQVLRHNLKVKKDGNIAVEVLKLNGMEPPRKIEAVLEESEGLKLLRELINQDEHEIKNNGARENLPGEQPAGTVDTQPEEDS
jgi:hypothetical protein